MSNPSNATQLLPPNATPFERAVAAACAALGETPVPIRSLWNPETCPRAFLPHLAWQFSVDSWDSNWSEANQRAAIQSAYYLHRHKGTVAAVRRVVETLGYLIRIVEWWQTTPRGPRGTFTLQVGVRESGITDAMFHELERLIDDARPVSRHLVGLAIHLETRGYLTLGAQAYSGDALTVYPWTPDRIAVNGVITSHGATHLIDTVTVYP